MAQLRRIIVPLSTGKQGTGVVHALAKRNSPTHHEYEILAVTRSAASAKAKKLEELPGVILLESEYDPDAIFQKASSLGSGGPIHGLFSVQQSTEGKGGVAAEIILGKKLADAAAKNKVQHFIYSSVDIGKFDKTDVPHFESKRDIEEYLKEKYPQMPLTILRTVTFMDNFSSGTSFGEKLFNTCFTANLKQPMQMIACSDIGEFAALAFEQPEHYVGQTRSIAGDKLDAQQVQQIYKRLKGAELPTSFGFLGAALLVVSKELRTMFHFFNEEGGFTADIDKTKKTHPGLKTWEEYIKTEM